MKNIAAALLALGCVVLSQAAFAQASTDLPEPLKGVRRIVCLGDSITQGGEGRGGYVWLLRHYLAALYGGNGKLGIEVINAGISGHKSNDMLARFQRDVLDKKPDLVTISVGVNDVWHGFDDSHPAGDGPKAVPLPEYRKNVEMMVNQAQAAGVKVVIVSTTVIHEELQNPENTKIVGYNTALRDIARKHRARFVDFQKPFQTLIRCYRETTGAHDLLLTVDGVHMNSLGNKVMAYTVLSGLGVTPAERLSVQPQIERELR